MAGKSVAVFFGGPSAEHAISLRSADHLIQSLRAADCRVLAVLMRRDRSFAVEPVEASADATDVATRIARTATPIAAADAVRRLLAEADVVFPVMHGLLGEDGALQGFLRVLGLPCVGPGVLCSALAMDKARSKAVLAATTTLHLPRGVRVDRHEFRSSPRTALSRVARLELPLIVKPVDGGSSVGLSRVERIDDLSGAVERALAVPDASGALIEEFVEGVEVTCAVIESAERGLEALPPILIRPRGGGLFDYEAKYTPGASEELCPAPLPAPALARIQTAALDAARALGVRGFARVDFILREGAPWFLELNTLPGLTRESLLPKAAIAAGYTLPQLFLRLVELAREGAAAELARAARASS